MRASRRAAELGSSEDALLSGSCPCRICTGWRKARRSRCRVVPRMNRAGWSEPSVCYFPPPTPASTSAQSSLQVSAPPHDPRHMTLSHFQGLRPKGRFDTAGCFQEADETNGWTNGISKAGQRWTKERDQRERDRACDGELGLQWHGHTSGWDYSGVPTRDKGRRISARRMSTNALRYLPQNTPSRSAGRYRSVADIVGAGVMQISVDALRVSADLLD